MEPSDGSCFSYHYPPGAEFCRVLNAISICLLPANSGCKFNLKLISYQIHPATQPFSRTTCNPAVTCYSMLPPLRRCFFSPRAFFAFSLFSTELLVGRVAILFLRGFRLLSMRSRNRCSTILRFFNCDRVA